MLRSTILSSFALIATAYVLQDDYEPSTFASKFDFFTDDDPTHGYVNYVDQATAEASGLYKVESDSVHIGVDANATASGRGRESVRVASKATYNHGLFILDLEHMPDAQCGSWPAFWLVGPDWPMNGEVDVIEGANNMTRNTMSLHTTPGCQITNHARQTGTVRTSDCQINATGQSYNSGCSVHASQENSYGSGFNSVDGGVYATEWTSERLAIWFFPRPSIPANIAAGNPDPSTWGVPLSEFSGSCDIDAKLKDQRIIFDITFCGDWAGQNWSSNTTCGSKAPTCVEFVQNNPAAFNETYWQINSLKVFQTANSTSNSTAITTSTALPTTDFLSAESTVTTASILDFTTSFEPSVVYSNVSTALVTSTDLPNNTTPAPMAANTITADLTVADSTTYLLVDTTETVVVTLPAVFNKVQSTTQPSAVNATDSSTPTPSSAPSTVTTVTATSFSGSRDTSIETSSTTATTASTTEVQSSATNLAIVTTLRSINASTTGGGLANPSSTFYKTITSVVTVKSLSMTTVTSSSVNSQGVTITQAPAFQPQNTTVSVLTVITVSSGFVLPSNYTRVLFSNSSSTTAPASMLNSSSTTDSANTTETASSTSVESMTTEILTFKTLMILCQPSATQNAKQSDVVAVLGADTDVNATKPNDESLLSLAFASRLRARKADDESCTTAQASSTQCAVDGSPANKSNVWVFAFALPLALGVVVAAVFAFVFCLNHRARKRELAEKRNGWNL